MFAHLARNEKYGWFVIVVLATSSMEVNRCFQCADEYHAFLLFQILRYGGIDQMLPLFQSGMHFQEFTELAI